MTKKNRRTAGLALAICLLVPALTLGAELPAPEDPTIRPANSIGGVRLGDSLGQAEEAFGGSGDCERFVPERGRKEPGSRLCIYGDDREPEGFAALVAFKGKIAIVGIAAGVDRDDRTLGFTGPLLELATERGAIGLGDRIVKLRRYYPRAELEESGKFATATIRGRRGVMILTTDGSKAGKRVTVIALEAVERSSDRPAADSLPGLLG